MRALLLALCATPAVASPSSVVSVGLDASNASHVQFNGDVGLTESGLPTARAEMVVALSGVQLAVAPLKASSLGYWADNGAAAYGWHSVSRSDTWFQARDDAACVFGQQPHFPVAHLAPMQFGCAVPFAINQPIVLGEFAFWDPQPEPTLMLPPRFELMPAAPLPFSLIDDLPGVDVAVDF